MAANSERISPTAHATGYLWFRHGLSHPGLVTPEGRRLDRAFRLLTGAIRLVSGVSLEHLMLARHHGIDTVLARAIDAGRVTQVVEVAAGLSARGWRFVQRYPELTYVETDLPAMAATKRSRLQGAGLGSDRHRVEALDALAGAGPDSLAAVAATLRRGAGTAIVTEGLMTYLDPGAARGVWQRIAAALKAAGGGVYLADFYLRTENRSAAMLAFRGVLQRFVRGRMHVHFATVQEAVATLRALGFARVSVHRTRDLEGAREAARTSGGERVRVLEAWV